MRNAQPATVGTSLEVAYLIASSRRQTHEVVAGELLTLSQRPGWEAGAGEAGAGGAAAAGTSNPISTCLAGAYCKLLVSAATGGSISAGIGHAIDVSTKSGGTTTVTPPAATASCNPAEPCTTVAQTCTTSPPYCCTQSLDWVEGRCVLVAA